MAFVSDPIRTERLLLRAVRPDDVRPIFDLFANWEVIRWLSSPPWPYTLDDTRAFVDAQVSQEPDKGTFLVITVADAPIGGIGVRPGNATEAPARSPILGYWLGQPHWGRSYMTEAARGFIGRIFSATAVDTIYTGAFADNAASLRVQEKVGFERTGEMMLYCRPRGEKLAHVNTRLARTRFLAGSQ
jgi:RimJ/RimL family protein N-acetyltransferase